MDNNESIVLVFIEGLTPTDEERALAEKVRSKRFRTLLGVSDMSFIEAHTGAVAVDMKRLPQGCKPLQDKPALVAPPALRPGLTPPATLAIPGVTAEA